MSDFIELHDLAAEMCYLGSLLLTTETDVLARRISPVMSGFFWRPAHRIIFSSIERISNRGDALDIVSLESDLTDRGKMADIGGPDYLIELAVFVPSPANWETHMLKVIEKAQLRAFDQKWQRCRQKMLEGTPVDELIAMDQTPIVIGSLTKSPIEHISEIELLDFEHQGIKTGIPELDDATGSNGLPVGQTSVIRADHKGGKTTFMISIFVNMAMEGKKVLYVTLGDLNKNRLKGRVMRNISTWSMPPHSDIFALEDFMKDLEMVNTQFNAWFYDSTRYETGCDVKTVTRWIDSLHQKVGLDCVFIDYAQKLVSSQKFGGKTEEQDFCSTYLSRYAEKENVTIVVGSQSTADGNGGKGTTKNSRKWEEDAGFVLALDDDSEHSKKAEITRNRFGHQNVAMVLNWDLERLLIGSRR